MTGKARMTPPEAFVETLVANGVTDVVGIADSARMGALDLFPAAGIRFRRAGRTADGYAKVSGRLRAVPKTHAMICRSNRAPVMKSAASKVMIRDIPVLPSWSTSKRR